MVLNLATDEQIVLIAITKVNWEMKIKLDICVFIFIIILKFKNSPDKRIGG